MGYYRAALAAAALGDLSAAEGWARCSLALGEDAAQSRQLLALLQQQNHIDEDSLARLRTLTESRRYRKALKLKLPRNARAHNLRGLLYARLGRHQKARTEFALALSLDTGNVTAKRALLCCQR